VTRKSRGAGRYSYDWPHHAITTDCVVFGIDEESLKVLLIERGLEPFRGQWALPGGFLRPHETIDECAVRELAEETGLEDVFLEQLYTFGRTDRDPRERVVTVAYYALVRLRDRQTRAATDARQAAWFPVAKLPPLAFDHRDIIATARERLRGKVRYMPLGFELLPRKFTLTELQQVYEMILERPLDKRNFRKKVLAMEVLVALDERQRDVPHRAARLYRFDKRQYERLIKRGFDFEV